MLVEDLSFYFSHRLLHVPWLYPRIHKIHHEHKVSFSLASMHTHPLEYVFGNIIPVILGPGILGARMHRASVFGWYFMRAWESLDGHCGYSFSWSPFRILPCQPEGDYHYFHHESNVGNYSTFFTWWDTVFGTNSSFYKAKKIPQT
jgi:sterol desaturase/sphingolipid hydroxylase (fatty acid hydroxylase superfamily)